MSRSSRYEHNTAQDQSRQHNGDHNEGNQYNSVTYRIVCSNVYVSNVTATQGTGRSGTTVTQSSRRGTSAAEQSNRPRQNASLLISKSATAKRARRLLRKYEAWKKEQCRSSQSTVVSREPNVLQPAPILFEDLSGSAIKLPYEYFSRWITLHAHLQCIFENRPGVDLIRRQSFMFVRLDTRPGRYHEFEPSKWEDFVVPGMRIAAMMDFRIEAQSTSLSCPCGSSCREINEITEVLSCNDCGRPYNAKPSTPKTLDFELSFTSGCSAAQVDQDSPRSTCHLGLQSCFKGIFVRDQLHRLIYSGACQSGTSQSEHGPSPRYRGMFRLTSDNRPMDIAAQQLAKRRQPQRQPDRESTALHNIAAQQIAEQRQRQRHSSKRPVESRRGRR